MSKARNMARMGQDASAGYTGAFDMPAGTTAERPASAGLGWTRLNTDSGSVEVYDGTNWNAVTRPFISSITGTIYSGLTSNLVIAGQNFTSTVTVRFIKSGSTVADVSGVSVSAGSATVAVPAAVYGLAAGDVIDIKVVNSDGTISGNSISKTEVGTPTGGTIVSSGGYRYHTFTSSNNFVVPTGFTVTGEALIVAGGGGGGGGRQSPGGGGGGAGGLVYSAVTSTAGTYAVTVGAGGTGTLGNPDSHPGGSLGTNGGNSSYPGLTTAVGGGIGGSYGSSAGGSGGSGGGGAWSTSGGGGGPGGSGTSGQGNAGGSNSQFTNQNGPSGGGFGAAGTTGTAGTNAAAANGGIGTNTYSAWATATSTGDSGYYAGGGGGGQGYNGGCGATNPSARSSGGLGGGGTGGRNSAGNMTGGNGTTNTGGGGGGAGSDCVTNMSNQSGGNGGSGIVIIRYPLPT